MSSEPTWFSFEATSPSDAGWCDFRRDDPIGRLVLRVETGERPAGDELLTLTADHIRRMILPHHSNRWHRVFDVDDVVQEVQVALWIEISAGKLTEIDSSREFWAYVRAAVNHRIVTQCRREDAGKRGGRFAHVSATKALHSIASRQPSAHDLVVADDFENVIILLAWNIDDTAWAIVALRYYLGYTSQEIADCLSISVRTVNRALRRTYEEWLVTTRTGRKVVRRVQTPLKNPNATNVMRSETDESGLARGERERERERESRDFGLPISGVRQPDEDVVTTDHADATDGEAN